MTRIEKKIWPKWFALVKGKRKNYELRLADFACKTGDVLVLREWNPKTRQYTGRKTERRVRQVTRFKYADLQKFWSSAEIKKHGVYVLEL